LSYVHSKMDNEDIKLLLVRYITNQANDTEGKEVKHWIGLHPENELYFVELYEAWQNMLYVSDSAVDEEKAYQLFLTKIAPKKQPIYRTRWLQLAAVFLLFILSSALYVYLRCGVPENNSQINAANGAVKKIILNDGTIVWLNAGSKLKYDAGFGKTNRTVYLEGEAFFDVGHKIKSIPFLVNTKNYTIRDIGTKFNLKAYPGDPFFETTVIKGEVAVEGNNDNNPQNVNRIYIKPHQVLKIYYHSEKDNQAGKEVVAPKTFNEVRVLQVDSAKLDVYDGWKDDLLVFDGATLGDIAKVLERRYNVKITLDDTELQNIRYSGSFKSVPTISKVLQIIKQNTPVSYSIEGQNVTLTKNN
jgi:transmembrane sensor